MCNVGPKRARLAINISPVCIYSLKVTPINMFIKRIIREIDLYFQTMNIHVFRALRADHVKHVLNKTSISFFVSFYFLTSFFNDMLVHIIIASVLQLPFFAVISQNDQDRHTDVAPKKSIE